MKALVIGHARHGKDTAAEILRDTYGLTFTSSSMALLDDVVIPYLATRYGIVYDTPQACYEDRGNHRSKWFDAIAAWNQEDPTRLFRYIIERWDMYVGLRNPRELHAIKAAGLYDVCIWIDASKRLPLEPPDSMGLEPGMADYIIDNNGPLEDLAPNIYRLFDRLLARR